MEFIARTFGKEVAARGTLKTLAGTQDGAAYVCDYVLNKAMEGRLFIAQLGTATTPVSGRIGYDADQPEMVIDVPTGVTIIPVSIQVALEDSAGTDNEIVAEASPAVTGAGTSNTGTSYCMRLNSGYSSSCVYRYTYSGNGTAPASYVEFWRDGYAFADTTVGPIKTFAWSAYTSPAPVLVGPASLLLHITGTTTAPAGFAKVVWAEFVSDAL
jgi:hypothetical protein